MKDGRSTHKRTLARRPPLPIQPARPPRPGVFPAAMPPAFGPALPPDVLRRIVAEAATLPASELLGVPFSFVSMRFLAMMACVSKPWKEASALELQRVARQQGAALAHQALTRQHQALTRQRQAPEMLMVHIDWDEPRQRVALMQGLHGPLGRGLLVVDALSTESTAYMAAHLEAHAPELGALVLRVHADPLTLRYAVNIACTLDVAFALVLELTVRPSPDALALRVRAPSPRGVFVDILDPRPAFDLDAEVTIVPGSSRCEKMSVVFKGDHDVHFFDRDPTFDDLTLEHAGPGLMLAPASSLVCDSLCLRGVTVTGHLPLAARDLRLGTLVSIPPSAPHIDAVVFECGATARFLLWNGWLRPTAMHPGTVLTFEVDNVREALRGLNR